MIDKNKKLQQLNTFTWKETKNNEEERKIKEQKKKERKKARKRAKKDSGIVKAVKGGRKMPIVAESKQMAKEEQERRKERLEIDAMNNDNISAKLVQKGGGYTVGTSKNNKKWIQKRVDRYNARVWRGWREKE